jgi:hypothetical protein
MQNSHPAFTKLKNCQEAIIKFMTICIAAMGKGEKGADLIVFATDHMISLPPPLGQFERPIEKYKKINDNTIAMLSGNPLIFDDLLVDCRKSCGFDEIKKVIQKNMNSVKSDIIQKQLLDIFKMNYDYVKEVLKGPIPNPFIQGILDSLSKFNLNTGILLIGFEGDNAQIVEITETTMANLRDINFGAIGTGAVQAINTLLFQRHSKDDSLPTTIYNVYKAKRNAEVAIGVGKETDVIILTKLGTTKIDGDKIRILSKIYEDELSFGKTNKQLYELVQALIK